ncbi:MAG: DEAD/DEAH box helicase, partial [Nanoarchaeota archaeon]|nr:DEAD/DEAH box helicase [Nanoarchaeota archaeon]
TLTKNILEGKGKAVYIVPLKALANEKFKDFKRKYDSLFNIALSIGDLDSADPYLTGYDLIICTAEKLDSLIRHHSPWLQDVKTVIVDEIHLMNDPGRGPTLEILITILRQLLKNVQLIALSATIGNPKELAEWLDANLVIDEWRPVKLKKGVYFDGDVEFD